MLTPALQLSRIRDDLTYLTEAWPHLIELRIPGPPRPWAETPRRTGVLTEQDLERMGPKGIPRPAPADVSVLDLLASIATSADDMARTVITVVAAPPDQALPPNPASHDPRPWLDLIPGWLRYAHELDDRTVPWITGQLQPLVHRTARLLGDVRDGQALNGICPWCNGFTASGPGIRTLQIHYPVTDDEDDEPLIVCLGVDCNPPRSACGMRHDGHPAWARREWDWLATQLRVPLELDEADVPLGA
ncbi:hypothetical protein [Rhodococcus sp. NPDC003348]